jgi:hypothetical protein
MADQNYLIRPPQPPWWKRISVERWLGIAALLVALAAAAFTAWYAWEAHRQAETTEHARKDAAAAYTDQAKDVDVSRRAAERSAAAAENSAVAAQSLAKAMERSATAAEASANAGREALVLSRRELILGNRPDVQVSDSRLSKALTPNEKPVVTTRIFNSGKGRALKLENRGWIIVSPQRAFPYGEIKGPAPSIIDLASGFANFLQLAVELAFPLTAEMITSIDDGKLTLYVYGLSEYYDDTLDKPRKYTLHWCNFYESMKKPDNLALSVCREHNYTSVESVK